MPGKITDEIKESEEAFRQFWRENAGDYKNNGGAKILAQRAFTAGMLRGATKTLNSLYGKLGDKKP